MKKSPSAPITNEGLKLINQTIRNFLSEEIPPEFVVRVLEKEAKPEFLTVEQVNHHLKTKKKDDPIYIKIEKVLEKLEKPKWSQKTKSAVMEISLGIIKDIYGHKPVTKKTIERVAEFCEKAPEVFVGEKVWLDLIGKKDIFETKSQVTDNLEPASLENNEAIIFDIVDKFYGREFVFNRIEQFLKEKSKGYLTIIGQPGIGKSAIVGQYYHNHKNSCIAYSCALSVGIPQQIHFIRYIYGQLQNKFNLPPKFISEVDRYDEQLLRKSLQEASNRLEAGGKLVIAVDALDEAELSLQPEYQNILCLPGDLPENIYFLLTRRPFSDERLTVKPGIASDYMNLDDLIYAKNNRNDIKKCIKGYLKDSEITNALKQWIEESNLTEKSFVRVLAEKSESNFMYVSYLVHDIATGSYTETDFNQLPHGLKGYYQDHWRRMKMRQKKQQQKARILYTLLELNTPVTSIVLAAIVGQKVNTVYNFLENWIPFLKRSVVDDKSCFSIYHASFADFLREELREEKTGLTNKEINAYIDNYCNEEKSPEIYLRKPTYQIKAERWKNLYQTLTSYKFIAKKINCKQFAVHSLIADYEDALRSNRFLLGKQEEVLTLIRDALLLSSHIVSEYPNQLASRLWGHLQDKNLLEIKILLEQSKRQHAKPWLRPIRKCFQTPSIGLIKVLEKHINGLISSLVITPDGSRAVLAFCDQNSLYQIQVLNLKNYKLLKIFTEAKRGLCSIAITPDSQKIIAGWGDGTLKIWNLNNYRLLKSIDVEERVYNIFQGLVTTPDGKKIIYGYGHKLYFWESKSFDILRCIKAEIFKDYKNDMISSLAITPDGQKLIFGTEKGNIHVWDLQEYKLLKTFSSTYNTCSIFQILCIIPNSQKLIVTLGKSIIEIWDLQNFSILKSLNGHTDFVSSLTVTPDGQKLISNYNDGTLQVWDLQNYKLLRTFISNTSDSCYRFCITHNGSNAISAQSNGTLKVWDMKKITQPEYSVKLTNFPDLNEYIPDEKQIKLGWIKNEIKTLNLYPKNRKSNSFREYSWNQAIAITPDNRRAIVGHPEIKIKRHEIKKFQLECHKKGIDLSQVYDDSLYVTCYYFGLKILDLKNKKYLADINEISINNALVSISPDSQLAVVGGYCVENKIGLWNLQTGKKLACTVGHSNQISSLCFIDNQRFVSISSGGSVKVWKIDNLYDFNLICDFYSDFGLSCLYIESHRSIIAAGNEKDKLVILKLEE